MSGWLADLAQWAVGVVYSSGYIGVAVLIGFINLHLLPIPTQIVLCLAGFLVGQGQFSFALVLLASTAGAVAASLVLYAVGLWIGEQSLRRLVKRFERFKLFFGSDLDKASVAFEKHGGKAILTGHLVPGIGALISVPAGIKKMPILGGFTTYTVLGSALWNGIFIVLGWVLGENWESVKEYAKLVEYAVLALIVGGLILFVRHRWKAYTGARGGKPPEEDR